MRIPADGEGARLPNRKGEPTVSTLFASLGSASDARRGAWQGPSATVLNERQDRSASGRLRTAAVAGLTIGGFALLLVTTLALRVVLFAAGHGHLMVVEQLKAAVGL